MRRSGGLIATLPALSLVCGQVLSGAPTAQEPGPPPLPDAEVSLPVVGYGSGVVKKAALTGSAAAPEARGSAGIAARGGPIQISLKVAGLAPAADHGAGLLTYVAWAVPPEGRAENLGELRLKSGKGKLRATTHLPTFGIMITAEPYFAVGIPGDAVVLQNAFEGKTAARASPATARVRVFESDIYAGPGGPAPEAEPAAPGDIDQARNAIRIATAFGADTYARDALSRAADALAGAESLAGDSKSRGRALQKAREAVQAAEAARVQAVRVGAEVRAAAESAAAAARAAVAEAEAEQARAMAAQEARLREEAMRSAGEEARRRAEAEQKAGREAYLRGEAERLAADEAAARTKAEAEQKALRAKLLAQFNLILETRDTARGLILNLGDVLFDVDRFSLRPEAREKLAKLSGVVLAHPGLTLDVEGHTDATGGDEYNQHLSQRRAMAVRDYLVEQKVPSDSITARGFGKTRPVAPNDTAANRQKNRRVEIVISGETIGTPAAGPSEGGGEPAEGGAGRSDLGGRGQAS